MADSPLRGAPELDALRSWARASLETGPSVDAHELDLHRYRLSALLDDLADVEDPLERAVVLADATQALVVLLLLAHGQWLGSGKWLVRRVRAWDAEVADRIGLAMAQGDPESFTAVADGLLEPLGGRLQAGFVR